MSRTPPKPPDERILADSWAQTPPDVPTVVQALAEEVSRLREQSKRSSRNSSQPLSKDSLAAKAQQAKAREERRSGCQRGGQRGHPGQLCELLAVEGVDEIVVCKPSGCMACGCLLLGEDSQPQRHQVTELRIVRACVIEYQVHRLTCALSESQCRSIASRRGNEPVWADFGKCLGAADGTLPPEQAPSGGLAEKLLRCQCLSPQGC